MSHFATEETEAGPARELTHPGSQSMYEGPPRHTNPAGQPSWLLLCWLSWQPWLVVRACV